MPIITKKINEFVFDNLDKLEKHFKTESETIKYLPIIDYINQDSIFMDDEFYGRGTNWVSFNEAGFSAFCSLIGIPQYFISAMQKKGLASDAINDYLSNQHIKEKLSNYRFVIDTSNKNTVLGIVSNKYQEYSNLKLFEDIKKNFPKILDKFQIHESYIVNTNLYLRMLSGKISSGKITGYGGYGDDISEIGLQVCNSMVGNSSVKVSYFIYRLVCANGLIVETGNTTARVRHSGNSDTFVQRLKNTIPSALKGMGSIEKMLITLNEIQYDPYKIVDSGGAELIYNIIPLSDSEKEKRKKLKKEDIFSYDAYAVSEYPQKYSGNLSSKVFDSRYRNNQSMFDFVNLFTEYAHTKNKDIERRIEIEKKTGEFVNWIIKNKKKLQENKYYEQRGY